MRSSIALVSAVVALAGCAGGETSDSGPIARPHDAGMDAATSMPPDADLGDAPAAQDAASSPDALPGLDAASTDAITDLDRLRALVAALPSAAGDTDRATMVSTFFDAVAYGDHGFPIVEDGMLGVAVSDTSGSTLTVAGDFNHWDASALRLLKPVAGFPFYYLITPIAAPTSRSLYKLVRNGTDYFADPQARSVGWDNFGEYSLVATGTAASHIERWFHFAMNAGTLAPREIDVYVPPGYDAQSPLPVLYMHDGQNLFDPSGPYGSWKMNITADQKIADGSMRRILIVGVDNTSDRFYEYTQTEDEIANGAMPVGGGADLYTAFLVTGVKPFIDARYRTLSDRASTAVLGSSLGGLVSLYAAYRYPMVYGHAASMSGSLDWGTRRLMNPTILDLYMMNPPLGVGIYLDSGGGPGTNGCVSGDDSDNYCANVQMHDELRSLGFMDGVDLFYTWAPNALHNEAAWAARVPNLLQTWFPGHP
jgi:predicted alpha/beta superfamily hydrolase